MIAAGLDAIQNTIGHSHVFTGMNALIGLVAIPPWHVEGNRLALVGQRHRAHIAVHRCARLRTDGISHRLSPYTNEHNLST